MALIQCPDCGKEFSDQAAACPNCSRPNKAPPPATEKKGGCLGRGCLGLLLIFVVVGMITAVVGDSSKSSSAPSSTSASSETDDGILKYQGEDLVKRQLRDPESADFRDVIVVHKGSDVTVCGSVNAKNGFGGFSGYSDFLVIGPLALIEPNDGSASFVRMWNRYCAKSTPKAPAPRTKRG